MKKVSLSNEEIEQLFVFVKSKYVHYRDVQHKIVDHLASGIEELITEDQTITFDRALRHVYGRFPITGFTQFVASKEKETHRYWCLQLRNYIKSYFLLPKIIILLAMVSMIVFGIFNIPIDSSYWSILSVLPTSILLLSLIPIIRHQWSMPKDILIINTYNQVIYTGHIFLVYILTNPFAKALDIINISTWPLVYILALSFIISLLIIGIYASYFVFPQKLQAELKNKYAHLELV